MAEKNTTTNLEQAQAAAWDAIKETQESVKETQESVKEMRKSLQESTQELREFIQKSTQESRRETQELRESITKQSESIVKQAEILKEAMVKQSKDNEAFNKRLEESNKRSGKFDRKFGELWELMVVPNIKEKFNELGFRFDSVARDLEFDKPNGKTLAEVDILLENGEYAIVVEVKDSFKKKYLEEHLDRMKKLKTLPRFASKKLYGAIAAGFSKGESKQLAFENGFYVVHRPDSMNVQIEQFPKGCKPRAW